MFKKIHLELRITAYIGVVLLSGEVAPVNLLGVVQRFTNLADQIGVKGSDPRVKSLMVTLRRSGFSSEEISELSHGAWGSSLIRQYTDGWQGVDEDLNEQKQVLMNTVSELASSGKSVQDVQRFLRLEHSVKMKGSNTDELIEFNNNLGELDLLPERSGGL